VRTTFDIERHGRHVLVVTTVPLQSDVKESSNGSGGARATTEPSRYYRDTLRELSAGYEAGRSEAQLVRS
jgi:hypothetical protein